MLGICRKESTKSRTFATSLRFERCKRMHLCMIRDGRSRKMLQNVSAVAIEGIDMAENEPKVISVVKPVNVYSISFNILSRAQLYVPLQAAEPLQLLIIVRETSFTTFWSWPSRLACK